ncbi:MAG TPA: adenylyl-sulfate kinase [Anaeromyxobacteraceae bacterium]|nr:adenylyl-sulfate kinase [Anaeromyxobacteraceae bacterium]
MRGAVVWVTGLPSAGKSTLARRVQAGLAARGRPAALLDGDEVRRCLVPGPGHLPAERDAFYETLARLAGLLARQGLVALVAATAHRQAHRDRARELAPRFVEVFVRTPAAECERRDAKGLYALFRQGKAPLLPGPGVPYESPQAPEVVADGGQDDRAVEAVLARLGDG